MIIPIIIIIITIATIIIIIIIIISSSSSSSRNMFRVMLWNSAPQHTASRRDEQIQLQMALFIWEFGYNFTN